jgi:uncharacterized repeat protein (TIGR01451 family)
MRYKVRLAWAIALLLVIQLALRSAAPVLAVRSVPAVAAPPALGLSNLAVTTYDDPSPPFSLPPYSAVAIPETTLQAASISIESSPPLVQDGDDPVPVTLQGNGASDGSGIHQYFVPFDDRELWELFEGKARCHGEQFQACLPLVSRIFVTAGANGTLWYYDHWEDGYDAEPLNPGPGSTTVTGTLDAGGTERFESNILVTQIGRAPYYYDGRDRITIEGEDANVVRWANAGSFQRSAGAACNPGGGGGDPDSSGWLAAAWEVLEVGDWGDVYHATVGEDLDYSSGVPDDHDYAGLEVMAAQDGTEVYYEGIRVATLDAGGTYFVPGSNPTDGPGGDGVDSSDDISATMPIQVQMMTGACSGNIVSAHGYTLQPRDVWDTVYWAPVPGFLQTGDPGERPNVDTDIYLHNPDRARAISVTVTSGLSVASLSIPPDSTVSVLRESGWPDLDEAQGTHMSSADVFWGVAVIDSATNGTGDSQDWDWGYSLVPESELSSQIVVGYAPGKPDLGDNGSLAFIVAAADTRIYVDLDHNGQPDRFDINGDGDANDNDAWGWDEGVSDQGVLVQAGQVLRVGDPVDRNLEGARIYTTELGEHIAAAWGQDPARADTLGYLDLGYTLLPLQVPHLLKKADLAVDADGSGGLSPGDTLTYTLVLDNNGMGTMNRVVLTDSLPYTYTDFVVGSLQVTTPPPTDTVEYYDGGSWGATPISTAQELRITWPYLEPTQTVTITFRALLSTTIPADVTYICNEGVASSANTDPVTATICTPLQRLTDLEIVKADDPDPVLTGGVLTYTLDYANLAGVDAQEVYITDTLPNEVTYGGMVEQPAGWSGPEYAAVPTATLTWYTPTLAAGASGRMVYTVTVGAGFTGTITNTVCISTTIRDGRDDNNCDLEPTLVTDIPPCDVEILKSDDPDPVGLGSPGRQLIYTLVYANNGPAPAENVVVSDTLPPEVAFGAASPAPSSGPNPLLWNLGTLAVGEGGTIAVTVTVHSWVGETFTNTACIATDTPEVSSDNCAQELTSILTDVAIGKSDYRDPGTPGGTLTYTLVYTNNGPFDAQEVYITDTLPGPDEVTFGGVLEQPPGWIGPHKTVGPPTKLIWYTPTLPAGPVGRVVTGTIVYTVTADPNVPGHITNTVRIDTTTPEYNYDNNQAAEPTSVRLLYFRARSQPGAVALEWETAWEVDTYGFSLLRSAGGRLAEAREIAFVPAAGRGGSGAAYSYRDRRLEIGPTYSYWLAELDTSGRRTVYYPVTAAALPGGLYRAYLPLVWRQ